MRRGIATVIAAFTRLGLHAVDFNFMAYHGSESGFIAGDLVLHAVLIGECVVPCRSAETATDHGVLRARGLAAYRPTGHLGAT